MVHARALPSSPRSSLPIAEIERLAVEEARRLAGAGFDALILENMHDTPYLHGDRLPPITVATMTRLALAVRDAVTVPLGIQILSGGNRHALAVAHAAGLGFIRCENFAYAHVADEGLLTEAEAPALLRDRAAIGVSGGVSVGASGVRVFADIKKKHASHALTADLSLADAARGCDFFGADGLIVTGPSTAMPADPADLAEAKNATALPVLVGSGVTPDTLPALFEHADACIVGSFLKVDGLWSNELDPARLKAITDARDAIAESR